MNKDAFLNQDQKDEKKDSKKKEALSLWGEGPLRIEPKVTAALNRNKKKDQKNESLSLESPLYVKPKEVKSDQEDPLVRTRETYRIWTSQKETVKKKKKGKEKRGLSSPSAEAKLDTSVKTEEKGSPFGKFFLILSRVQKEKRELSEKIKGSLVWTRIEKLTVALEEKTVELSRIQQEKTTLAGELKKEKEQKEKIQGELNQKIKGLLKEVKEEEEKNIAWKNKFEDMQKAKAELENKYKEIGRLTASLETTMEGELKKEKERKEKIQGELKEEKGKNVAWKNKFEDMRKTKAELENKYKEMQKLTMSLEEKASALGQAQKEKTTLEGELKEKVHRELSEKIKGSLVRKGIEKLTVSLKETMAELGKVKEEKTTLEGDLKKLNEKMKGFLQEMKEEKEKNVAWKNKFEDMEKIKSGLEDKYKKTQQTLLNLQEMLKGSSPDVKPQVVEVSPAQTSPPVSKKVEGKVVVIARPFLSLELNGEMLADLQLTLSVYRKGELIKELIARGIQHAALVARVSDEESLEGIQEDDQMGLLLLPGVAGMFGSSPMEGEILDVISPGFLNIDLGQEGLENVEPTLSIYQGGKLFRKIELKKMEHLTAMVEVAEGAGIEEIREKDIVKISQ